MKSEASALAQTAVLNNNHKLLTKILIEEISSSLSEPTPLNKDLCVVFEEIPKKILLKMRL